MNHTIERPTIEITDAPECWNLPEKEPEVYWLASGVILKSIQFYQNAVGRPANKMSWFGLTQLDAERDADSNGDCFERVGDALPFTPAECTDNAIELGREGVGVYTYEGDEKVCVKYWLVGDPLPGGEA